MLFKFKDKIFILYGVYNTWGGFFLGYGQELNLGFSSLICMLWLIFS